MAETTNYLPGFSINEPDVKFKRKPLTQSAESFLRYYKIDPFDTKEVLSYEDKIQSDSAKAYYSRNLRVKLMYHLFHKEKIDGAVDWGSVITMIFIVFGFFLLIGAFTPPMLSFPMLGFGLFFILMYFVILFSLIYDTHTRNKLDLNWKTEKLDIDEYSKMKITDEIGESTRDKVLDFKENSFVKNIYFHRESHPCSKISFISVSDDKGGKYYIDYGI